jgi:hypothetical protein
VTDPARLGWRGCKYSNERTRLDSGSQKNSRHSRLHRCAGGRERAEAIFVVKSHGGGICRKSLRCVTGHAPCVTNHASRVSPQYRFPIPGYHKHGYHENRRQMKSIIKFWSWLNSQIRSKSERQDMAVRRALPLVDKSAHYDCGETTGVVKLGCHRDEILEDWECH